MKITKLLLVPIALLLVSCDPAQTILFENKTPENAKVRIAMVKDRKSSQLYHQIVNDTVSLDIKPSETGMLNFGTGTWPDSEIAKVVSEIKSIEIETDGRKTSYTSQAKIIELFTQHRKGILIKNEIDIPIE